MDLDDALRFHADLTLNDPVMIAAFRGWNDAGDSASFAAEHLARVWDAQPYAELDPEEFYDFQAIRPHVELVDGTTRKISWPANDFFAARIPGGAHDIVIMVGTEPSHRWRTFSSLVIEVAMRLDVGLVITLGALMADVPHTRPVPITGTAADPELVERLGLQRSRYEGPTGIVGVLHDACARAGLASASLWAAMPHYLAVSPNPKGALALVDGVVGLTEVPADVGDLERAVTAYEERVGEMVAADEDVTNYVRLLEERADERLDAPGPADLPSGEALAAELEEYLRNPDK